MSAMKTSTYLFHTVRRYSSHMHQDPYLRAKAFILNTYLVSAFALPFVPPLMASRRAKKDGSVCTRYEFLTRLSCTD